MFQNELESAVKTNAVIEMYSLYRAWLSLGPSAGLPTLPGLSELQSTSSFGCSSQPSNGSPDVTLQVGPTMTHFSAHKNILSAHSGFFKAVFLNHTGPDPIPVPNINVDEFSSLLTFMYTGFLDLNYTNIYNILLATHILHMPRALELCRSFLMQHHPLEARPSIIKPIPSRKSILPHQQIFAPLFGNLNKSEATPFKSVEQKPKESTSKEEPKESEPKKEKKKRREDGREKVIVDVACCDGPVRFHRVLNKNYGLKNLEDTGPDVVDRSMLLNKVMHQSIRDKQSENENSDVFTCVYCNHTFKSQYCYQKHARRHLNPVNLDVKGIQKVENVVSKREVKLLDMNVQYYPCKTCGSKFPSYYFVHKHRKMCHSEEVAEAVKNGEKSNNASSVASPETQETTKSDDSEIEVGNDNQ